jgi:hypothetical protein
MYYVYRMMKMKESKIIRKWNVNEKWKKCILICK